MQAKTVGVKGEESMRMRDSYYSLRASSEEVRLLNSYVNSMSCFIDGYSEESRSTVDGTASMYGAVTRSRSISSNIGRLIHEAGVSASCHTGLPVRG